MELVDRYRDGLDLAALPPERCADLHAEAVRGGAARSAA